MNARYLWAETQMMEGNSDVIWGFIDDVWYWSQNKISPFDTSKKNKFSQSKSFAKTETARNSSICSIDDRYSIQLHNKCDSLYNLNVFEEQSRKVSPERNPNIL